MHGSLGFLLVFSALSAGATEPSSDPWTQEVGYENTDYLEARQLMKERKWPEAAIVLRSLLRKSPESSVTMDLVRALTYAGRREEALSLLGQAASREKKAPRLEQLVKRTRVLSRLFLTNSSFQIYQDGLNLMRAAKYRAARERFEKALEVEPDNVEVLVRIGQSLLLEKDEDSAAERLKLAKKLNPYEPQVRLWLGQAMYRRGELREAVEEFRLAHQELTGSQLAPLWFAQSLRALGSRDAAIKVLETDVVSNPEHLQSLILMAQIRLETASRDPQPLWAARKDLQVAVSRIAAYENAPFPAFEGEMGFEAQKTYAELKEEIAKLQAQVDGQLERVASEP